MALRVGHLPRIWPLGYLDSGVWYLGSDPAELAEPLIAELRE
jgi:hypothetical protein